MTGQTDNIYSAPSLVHRFQCEISCIQQTRRRFDNLITRFEVVSRE